MALLELILSQDVGDDLSDRDRLYQTRDALSHRKFHIGDQNLLAGVNNEQLFTRL